MFEIVLQKNLKKDVVYLSEKTLKQINTNSENITLHFGAISKKLKMITDHSLETGKIIIPQKLNSELLIPDLPYDNYFKQDHLFLGPVIGYIVVERYFENPHLISLRFTDYEKIRGLIFLFRPNTINPDNDTIYGKYYDPVTKTFIQGVFPFPSAIYNRNPLSSKTYNLLISKIGDNLFNYPFFNTNKWSFWNWMSKEPSISDHLPQTTEFTGSQSLRKALKKHQSIYIKPTSLSQGRGILHVLKSDSKYILTNLYGYKYYFKSLAKLSYFLEKNLIPTRNYIIQQAIPFLNEGGNKIDFRVYLQKDYWGKWKYSGMETKVAKKGSIISNSRNRQQIVPGDEALASFFGLNTLQRGQKIEEITQLGSNVLKVLEQNGAHLGDAAIDMILDNNHKVWLLEVQLNYAADKKARRHEDEQRVLPAILPTPFEYAKALAGF